MKELSIEEKAKRYDDVIEELRGLLEGIHEDKCNIMEEDIIKILPELRESKDESIKEWLINLVKGHIEWLEDRIREQLSNGQVYGDELVKAKNSLAWLEKQGKNNMSISEATKQELEDNLNKALEKETPESCNEFLEKQGEQKTAEEYNITGIGSKNAQGKLGEMIKNLKPVNEVLEQKTADKVEPKFKVGDIIKHKDTGETYEVSKIEAIYADEIYYHLTNGGCVCENSDNFERVEQKSVTDLRTWKYIVDAVLTEKEGIGQYLDSPFTEEVAKKLQKRFGNIEQKSAWSEEDKTMVEDIIEAIDTQYAVTDYNEMVNWLKSLKDRYTWKPSDEQIKALEDAIEFLGCTKKVREDLKSLYEQLKRLKS